jgi:hypothetical protein
MKRKTYRIVLKNNEFETITCTSYELTQRILELGNKFLRFEVVYKTKV